MNKKYLYALFLAFFLFTVAPVLAAENESQNFSSGSSPQVSESVQRVAQFFFGIPLGASISFSTFVILLALTVFIFLIMLQLVRLMPFFEHGVSGLMGAFIITALIAYAGGIYEGAQFVISVFSLAGFSRNSAVAVVLFLVLLVVLGYGIKRFLKILKEGESIIQAEQTGFKMGAKK